MEFSKIIKEFAVWNNGKGEELVLVQPGYFASDQWLEVGNCDGIAGTKFGILGNDGVPGPTRKQYIRPLASMEEFEELKGKSSVVFKRVLELKDLGEKVIDAMSVNHYRRMGRKVSYICEYIVFYPEDGQIKSAHQVWNDNQSGLEPLLVDDEPQVYDINADMTEPITAAIKRMQGSGFLDEVQEHLMKLLNMKGVDFDIDNAKAVLINIVDVPAFEAYIYRRGITFYAGAMTSDGKKQYFYR